MILDDAYRRLPEYLDGGLLPHEREEIERLFGTNPELRHALRTSLALEAMLRRQPWLTPSPKFAKMVVKRALAEMPPRVTTWEQAWERIRAGLSVGALALILVFAHHPLAGWGMAALNGAGAWLGGLTGLTVFVLHPVAVLGVLAPVAAGGVLGCVLSGRCRFSSD
jgi:anti-sigma factor RsiW